MESLSLLLQLAVKAAALGETKAGGVRGQCGYMRIQAAGAKEAKATASTEETVEEQAVQGCTVTIIKRRDESWRQCTLPEANWSVHTEKHKVAST